MGAREIQWQPPTWSCIMALALQRLFLLDSLFLRKMERLQRSYHRYTNVVNTLEYSHVVTASITPVFITFIVYEKQGRGYNETIIGAPLQSAICGSESR